MREKKYFCGQNLNFYQRMEITKQLLDEIYSEHFDLEKFKSVDPCGVVYELVNHVKDNPDDHPEAQLDIELGALFVAMISWGSRKAFRPVALKMLRDEMKWHPASFIRMGGYEQAYTGARNQCVYRTLNVPTFRAVCRNLQWAIQATDTLEHLFEGKTTRQVIDVICLWLAPARVGTMDKSACKRVCMYVRWMTRKQKPDLGLWQSRSQSDLYAVMDTHVLQLTQDLLSCKRPTWKACEELTRIFQSWDADDPLKYDVALMTLADMENGKTGEKNQE